MTRTWLGPIVLAAAFIALTAWSWRAWPDPLVDFGRELYVPWQLSEGAVLYRDIAYFNGPLSPYWNALLFQIFGVSLTTLAVANLTLLAILTGILYRWLAAVLDELSATVAGLVFLTAFAFAQLTWVSNYNFVCPYSHEMTHGILLCFAMLSVLRGRFKKASWTGRDYVLTLCAGIFWGLTFLGKAEVFIAATGAAVTVFAILTLSSAGSCKSRALLGGVIFLAAGILPVCGAFGLLATQLNPMEALLGTVGAWRWVLGSAVIHLPFYRMIAGLDHPWMNMQIMLLSTFRVSLVVLGIMSLDRCRATGEQRLLWLAIAAAMFLLEAIIGSRSTPFLLDGACLLSVSIILATALVWHASRCSTTDQQFGRFATLTAWAVMALLLMGKQVLRPQLLHYGFALSMPVTVLAVALLVSAVPPRLCRDWKGGAAFRTLIVLVLLGDMFSLLSASATVVNQKSTAIGSPVDRFVTFREAPMLEGPVIQQALREIETRMPKQATFVVLPDGVMLNYLSRRTTTIRYINFMPPEMTMFGEREIVESLDQSAPDFVILVHKDTREYGSGLFGSRAYGDRIMKWVNRCYEPVKTIGSEPFQTDRFGIKILARRDSGVQLGSVARTDL